MSGGYAAPGPEAAPFIGAWRLVRYTSTDADGAVSQPLGAHPGGQIAYTPNGAMSAQLVREEGHVGDERQPAYTGYFGAFTVDPAVSVVTHHVEGSSISWMVGTDQPRHYVLRDDLLILSAQLDSGRVELTWQRVDSDPATFRSEQA